MSILRILVFILSSCLLWNLFIGEKYKNIGQLFNNHNDIKKLHHGNFYVYCQCIEINSKFFI